MTFEQFLDLVERTPDIARRPNAEQEVCLAASPARPTMIVAGPGSGKTTVLVLRALRHMLVDRLAPERIVITTFTKKAAREIRSRLIEWGEALVGQAAAMPNLPPEDFALFQHLDVNRVVTGTLDSICQEALGSDRHADEPPLVTLEAFAANVILQRRGRIGQIYRANEAELGAFLAPFTMDGTAPNTVGDAAAALVPIVERFIQDRVDVGAFGALGQPLAHQLIAAIATDYRTYLRDNNLLDFSSLEEAMLRRLQAQRVPTLLAETAVVLVDEYQDTNALQEAIYFELVSALNASFTVVGDDDQSLYRFRGATIELFRAFIARCEARLGTTPQGPLYLVENYRSTPEIVNFFNGFIREDPNFAPARIQPPKPVIRANADPSRFPVLAMFRPDAETLADHLSGFLHDVFRGGGYRDPNGNYPDALRGSANGGDLGDAVMLGFSVLEQQRPYFGNPPKPRFVHHLRVAMQQQNLAMFNPRGQSLRDIEQVEQLLGLTILAIDPSGRPGGQLFEAMPITNVAKFFMRRWVTTAQALLATRPAAIYGKTLQQEVADWSTFVLGQAGEKASSRDWPLLDVIYGLVPWIPHFEEDPEGQVYLEAISRAAGQAAGFSAYSGKLVRPASISDENDHGRLSVLSVLRDVIAPIAENVIDVDEEIMPSVPRDRLNVMTIHQAKGLEYPLVIVDVGADFSTNSPKNRFRRFPDAPSATAQIEDVLAPFTPDLGALRMARSALDRSFEDLIRLYYVAFSRPQSVLMLVGCDKMLKWNSTIKHVATGWRQDDSWAWRDTSPPYTGRRPPAVVTPPSIQFV
ncbi:UvrD-helicase domain-containing protein [Sphingomonas kyeonggiensis]|uniref:DNA 3'-5' helicase n=1 Tax=Sphingomonas kyeonggiensis TaxID=1268553 RepID=A0A7W6NYM1_9SPHN|nr:ATP-dependent helicase [Sphingomonas kyeonggiensis]MBB4100493.1 DNA helicase-2/ATP-dependent DNA helicase PcrA [Sphingomonas kyeonggiensis]